MNKRELKECKQHGLTNFYFEKSSNIWRCMRCRSEAVLRWRKKQKPKFVQQFGGKCEICGYNKCIRALHFHHVFPETKSFGIAHDGLTRSKKSTQEELKKCILVCSNCHAD